MTNYHVVKRLLEDPDAGREDVAFRFDYRRRSGAARSGTVYKLVEQAWCLDSSPNSTDKEPPQPNQLDYVLLRLNGSPGGEPPGGTAAPDAQPRGWIPVPSGPYPFHPGKPLFIVQHPGGGPLSLALETSAIIGPEHNGLRVRYKTNTDEGSSGSPCFDIRWNLVAIHHADDPGYRPNYNEGIPVAAIYQLLKARGRLEVLGRRN